jgi:hypothetical protein
MFVLLLPLLVNFFDLQLQRFKVLWLQNGKQFRLFRQSSGPFTDVGLCKRCLYVDRVVFLGFKTDKDEIVWEKGLLLVGFDLKLIFRQDCRTVPA